MCPLEFQKLSRFRDTSVDDGICFGINILREQLCKKLRDVWRDLGRLADSRASRRDSSDERHQRDGEREIPR